jgi:DNA-binding transcriptional LysR family regulator
LARAESVAWADLAPLPWVVPPAWASSRVKLHQMFYKHRLEPPADVIESASYLVTVTFLRQRPCVAFVADEVARDLAAQHQCHVLDLAVPIDLPPVGLIRLRRGAWPPAAESLAQALRGAVGARGG